MNDYVVPLCSLNAYFVFHKIENDIKILPCTTTLQITTLMEISNELVNYVLSYSDHKVKAARRLPPARPFVMVMTIPLTAKG